jgi:hypothetical protein
VNVRVNLDLAPTGHAARPRRLGRRLARWAVNLWLVFHVAAIIIAPASVRPSSDLVRSAWRVVGPYLQVLYLNHGYHFFAPEPAESTLLAFEAELGDGTVIRGRIPDRGIVPRLLYHRHFMLTEHMNQAEPEIQEQWYASYAQHIAHAYGARRVTLTRVIHYLPTMEMVRDGVTLDDPASYEAEPLGEFR